MKESLCIKNFGPINEINLENISPVTVLIGESGSGKSTVLKIIVLFRWIYKKLCMRSYLKSSGIDRSPFIFNFKAYIRNSGWESYITENTIVRYKRDSVEISYEKGRLNVVVEIPSDEISFDKMSFICDKRNLIPELLSKNIKERSANFFLNETYTDFLEASRSFNNLDIPYFGIDFTKKKTSNGLQFFVEKDNGESKYSVNFEDASSGMQNTIPIEIIIDYYVNHYNLVESFNQSLLASVIENGTVTNFKPTQDINSIKNKNIFFHIEEPELSLYPNMQIELMEGMLKKLFSQKREIDFYAMIATHSPYIVNYLNLAIKSKMVDYDNLGAYLLHDGGIESLKHDKEKVIDTTILSSAILDIYEKYNRI